MVLQLAHQFAFLCVFVCVCVCERERERERERDGTQLHMYISKLATNCQVNQFQALFTNHPILDLD
jgi:hypothetical protein